MFQINETLNQIIKIKKIRERRTDPNFWDYKRYAIDLKYILDNVHKEDNILDIGAGAGIFSIALKILRFNVTVTGISKESETEINFYKEYGIRYVSNDLDQQKIPFASAKFDAVLFLHVLEHLRRPYKALTEIHRVLKPGGTLILMTPNGAITSLYKKFKSDHHKNAHIKEFTISELTYLLKTTGFEIMDVKYSKEMVLASLKHTNIFKKIIGYPYIFICKFFPFMNYEIHITAQVRRI